LLSLGIALSAGFVKTYLPTFEQTGSFIGASVSSIFLLIIGIINLVVFIDIYKVWKKVLKGKKYKESDIHEHLHNRGLLARLFRPFLKTVTQSWHMYIVGFLFGLGFDTASEVALLSISAATGTSTMPLLAVLLLPLAFTSGMALIDTFDGILMLGAYGWAYIKPVRKLYYNLNITLISVIVALGIGGIEAIQVLSEKLNLHGPIIDNINTVDFGNLGYFIIFVFFASWVISLGIYKYKRYDLLETS
jgi:high-affinity nickel-transport protein